jgi:hypothetical protein
MANREQIQCLECLSEGKIRFFNSFKAIFGKHSKKCHSNISREEYAKKYHTEEWIKCDVCNKEIFRNKKRQHIRNYCSCKCARVENNLNKEKINCQINRCFYETTSSKNFDEHLKQEHNLTREEYVLTFKLKELKLCCICKKEFYSKNRNKKTCSKYCAKKSQDKILKEQNYYKSEKFKDRNTRSHKTQKINEPLYREKRKEQGKKTSKFLKEFFKTKEGIESIQKGLETKKQNGTLKGSGKKAAQTRKNNGYYESEAFKEGRKKARLTRKANGLINESKEEIRKRTIVIDLFGENNVIKHRDIDFKRSSGKNDCQSIDFSVSFECETIHNMQDGSYFHGHNRPLEIIKEFKTKTDKVIYKTYFKDIEFNNWCQSNKINLVRFLEGEKEPWFICGNEELITKYLDAIRKKFDE